MTCHAICGIAIFQCWLIYCIIVAIIICVFENVENNFSENKKICYSLCWPLAIIILPIFYLIKKHKLNIKLKEANKLEEYRRKKETVYIVLRELKIR